MKIGQLELRLNKHILTNLYYGSKDEFRFPWITLALRIPSVMLPFYRKNDWGEMGGTAIFCISAPTLIQISSCDNISWEVHLMILGFGISFIYQYGY
jgi:hypothetical protein